MQITITKGERGDRIDAIRADGSNVSTTFPHKGPIPHDAVHFYVESELGLGRAFWGMVASGQHPEQVQEIAKAGGHASASRGRVPDSEIVEMVQAERAVECFEADLWGGSASDPDTFREAVSAGCAQSLVPAIELSDDAIASVRGKLLDLLSRWSALPQGQSIALNWALAAA
jgi:hypothetical protein